MGPNVLVFFLDDHAQWASGCYGNSEVQTPNIDYLASTGVLMRNAFTPTPVCSPARACFFTGRTSSQHGIHDYINTWDAETNAIRWLTDELMLPAILKDRGYATGLAGKWHLGRAFERPDYFDFWYETGDPRSGMVTLDRPWECGPPATDRYNPQAVTDHAVDFLRHRAGQTPFFLFVGYYATHSPWTGHAERLVGRYRTASFHDIPRDESYRFGRMASESLMETRSDPREALAQYYAAVTEVDEQVGRVLDELDSLGVREDTLVVYTSDHGLNMSHHGIWGKGNGTKPYNMLEESIRVPMIVNQPGTLCGGQIRSEFVTHCDLFQAIVDHAGGPLPADVRADRNYPGRSFRDLLLGGHVREWPERVFGEYGPTRMVRSARYKLIECEPENRLELFDLERDPRETVNVAGDPAMAPVVEDLRDCLRRYFSRYQVDSRSGLAVGELPSFNQEEVWRYPDSDSTWWRE